jgi:hypothetical protein
MVRGSGSITPNGRRTSQMHLCGAFCHRFGPVRWGLGGVVGQPAGARHPVGSLAPGGLLGHPVRVSFGTTHQAPPRFGRLVGTTLLGFVLVDAGLALAYLTITTPGVASLVPGVGGGGGSVAIGLGVWSFSLIAGGALLAAGTDRLARIVALVKLAQAGGGPAARALRTTDDLVVVANVAFRDGRPIPELVIGSFGAAVIHALPAVNQVRHGASGWESHRDGAWAPIEDPLDAAMRDADRVRRWLAGADLEFVVRVYAALVVDDRVVQRSPTCAVLAANQIPAWIASLPRQRTLTAGRRARLATLVQPG